MTFFASKRLLARCRRNIKRIDHTYNVVTTPITLCEISFDDIPDNIPCKDMFTCTFSNMCRVPNFQNVCYVYDNLSVDKDIGESVVSLYRQATAFHVMNDKEKVLYVLKCMSFVYKTVIVHSPAHDHHNIVFNVLDYLNFVISCC
jgi:hypothetical protein